MNILIFWCDCCWQSIPLLLCDHHIRLSPASLPNSTSSTPAQQPDTCSQCFFPGSEDGEHQPPPAKWPTVHADADLNQNASVFPSPIFCRPKRATLTPASAAPSLCLTIITASIHLRPRHLLRFRSYASGFMLKKTQGKSPFHTPVDPVQLSLNTSSQAQILKHRIPIHKIIVTIMLLRQPPISVS